MTPVFPRTPAGRARPAVSIVMPVRNEGKFIRTALEAVAAQDYDGVLETLVVDGDSDDDTPQLAKAVGAATERFARFEVLHNPARTVPTSLNMGVREARGDLIVRVDGHCVIAPDYVRRIVEVMAETGASCVGGRCITVGDTPTARAIALAQSSKFGVGNVAFRVGRAHAGPADTVPFGAYPKSLVEEFGGWDEELVRNQDDEFNFRLVQAGHTVWFDPTITATYHSRADLRRLYRQYREYGLFKVRVMQKRRGVASMRQLVPVALVTGIAGGVALTAATGKRRWILMSAGPYVAANAAMSVALARREDVPAGVVTRAFAALHFGYGIGFLQGLWRWRHDFGRTS